MAYAGRQPREHNRLVIWEGSEADPRMILLDLTQLPLTSTGSTLRRVPVPVTARWWRFEVCARSPRNFGYLNRGDVQASVKHAAQPNGHSASGMMRRMDEAWPAIRLG